MKVFTCIDHDCHWPVGCASVVVASDETDARRLLDAELRKDGLAPTAYTLQELPLIESRAVILNNGNY